MIPDTVLPVSSGDRAIRVSRPVASRRAGPRSAFHGHAAASADGHFSHGQPEVLESVAKAAKALGANRTVTIADAGRARAAAYIITACEGSNLHLPDLRTRPQDFDPVVIERFLAGALLPAAQVTVGAFQ